MADATISQPEALERALTAFRAGDLRAALELVQGALARGPDNIDGLHLLGLIEARRGRLAEGERAIARAVEINPAFAAAHFSRGHVLAELGRPQDAVASYDRVLALRPNHADAAFRRANLLRGLNRLPEALAGFDRTVALRPGHAEAWNNRGVVLKALGRLGEAIASYGRAVAARPGFAEAHGNLGLAHADANRHDLAAADFERMLAIDPTAAYAAGALAHARMYCCDWRHFEADARRLAEDVRGGRPAAHPFPFLALSDSAEDQLACARTWARDKCPPAAAPLWQGRRYRHRKIRVAYLSADFHGHATAYLAAGLFERHDRARFETTAISFGPDERDATRARLTAAFGRFIDVRAMDDLAVARLIREMEVDIAVDLKGFTKDARSRILGHRPAPVQVSYLGFPGTMGTESIDYVLADRTVIPDAHIRFYAERVVRLPGCYQANDDKRRIGEHAPTRVEAGLPERGFVFCSFNSSYKITPPVFDVWMRLLAQTPGSVLWLLRGNAACEANLRREAEARGIAPARLVFAPRLAAEDHLARHRLADLFLDTLPCNAHTTASDALWAGLPIVTCLGNAFAGRVAASLLFAAELPELAAASLEEYEVLAAKLASDGELLAATRAKLWRGRETCALFDTDRFRRGIESAYEAMRERAERGEKPQSFDVAPV